jgi:GT2 family glycosyltransferase
LNAFEADADVVILSNDDITPAEGDLDRLAEAAYEQRDCYAVFCEGYDARDRRQGSIRFGFFALNPLALSALGCLDQNFFPMYFEDKDYARRAALAGLKAGYCPTTNVIHEGSKNIYTVPLLKQQHHLTFPANRDYYLRKWGGPPDQETYQRPFERFSLKIAPEERGAPYEGFNRSDQSLVFM